MNRNMAEISKYRTAIGGEFPKAICTIAETLKEAILELEKLYAMSGKLDNLTHMKLKDMRKRIEEAVADIC